ncbi:MAG: ABC transporter permease [Syntrophales bacterium]|nr:ABC transporter permease [Syntrophales bacterium]
MMDGHLIAEYVDILGNGTWDTLYMTFLSTFFAYLFGLPMGVILVITDGNHILPRARLNAVLGSVVNVTRSVPFIILLIALIPLTRMIVGTSIGATASIVPLAIGAIPFVARMVETSMKELDRGIIEAAQSMGASPWQIICKVMVPETLPSLILGVAITTITLIGYSAMAGVVGGGGLGDIAIRYGYHRYQTDLMFLTIILLIVIVQIVQSAGNYLSGRIDKKNR